MSKRKGPAIAEDTFAVTGHCCGMRYTGIAQTPELGFDFQLTDEARESLKKQGVTVPAADHQTGTQEPANEPSAQR